MFFMSLCYLKNRNEQIGFLELLKIINKFAYGEYKWI